MVSDPRTDDVDPSTKMTVGKGTDDKEVENKLDYLSYGLWH